MIHLRFRQAIRVLKSLLQAVSFRTTAKNLVIQKSNAVASSSSNEQTEPSNEQTEIMPSGTYDCSKYKCFTTEFLNQDLLEAGKYGEILDKRDGQVYKTTQIGNQIWIGHKI
jgi:hypothetical protein